MISQLRYVGILKRFFALFIDGLVQTFLVYLFLVLGVSQEQLSAKFLTYLLLATLIQWAYFALMESSKARGTLGKMAVGISVSDQMGRPISLKQASLRFLGKYLWILIFFAAVIMVWVAQASGNPNSPQVAVAGLLMIVAFFIGIVGYVMAAFTPEKQALHDRLARTYVIEDEGSDRSIPQKVIFQILAIAIVSRLLFQVIPGLPITTPPSVDNGGTGTQSGTQSSTQSGTDNSNATATTLTLCGARQRLLPPSANSYIDGDWLINFAAGVNPHRSLLRMKGETGVMRTEFVDVDTNSKAAVLQQMRLRVSEHGIWLMGSNPVNAETQRPDDTYSPDNLFIQRSDTGELIAFNCDANDNLAPATISPANN